MLVCAATALRERESLLLLLPLGEPFSRDFFLTDSECAPAVRDEPESESEAEEESDSDSDSMRCSTFLFRCGVDEREGVREATVLTLLEAARVVLERADAEVEVEVEVEVSLEVDVDVDLDGRGRLAELDDGVRVEVVDLGRARGVLAELELDFPFTGCAERCGELVLPFCAVRPPALDADTGLMGRGRGTGCLTSRTGAALTFVKSIFASRMLVTK